MSVFLMASGRPAGLEHRVADVPTFSRRVVVRPTLLRLGMKIVLPHRHLPFLTFTVRLAIVLRLLLDGQRPCGAGGGEVAPAGELDRALRAGVCGLPTIFAVQWCP